MGFQLFSISNTSRTIEGALHAKFAGIETDSFSEKWKMDVYPSLRFEPFQARDGESAILSGISVQSEQQNITFAFNGCKVEVQYLRGRLTSKYKKIKLIIDPSEKINGLGMAFNSWFRNGRRYTLFNRESPFMFQDYFSYSLFPFIVSSGGWAFHLLNARATRWDFTRTGEIEIDLAGAGGDFIFLAGSPEEILLKIGQMLPDRKFIPKWALGLINTSFPVPNQKENEEFINQWKSSGVPLDGLILDYHWEELFHNFEWSRRLFPDPRAFANFLSEKKVRLGLIFTPFINRANHLFIKLRNRLFVKSIPSVVSIFESLADKKKFLEFKKAGFFASARAHWWFGRGGMIDFTSAPASRAFFAPLRAMIERGFDLRILKNDDGEYLPLKNRTEKNIDSKEMHNLYSLYYSKAVAQNFLNDSARRIIYPRNIHFGLQGLPALFLGDQQCSYAGMRRALVAGLNLSMTGFSFWTADLYGLAGSVSRELFIDHLTFSMFVPVARHFSAPHEPTRNPWHYGEKYLEYFKSMAFLRYSIVPLMYTLSREWLDTGMPIVRTAALACGERFQDVWQAFFIGENIAVLPSLDSATLSNDAATLSNATGLNQFRDYIRRNFISCADLPEVFPFLLSEFKNKYPLHFRRGAIIPLWSNPGLEIPDHSFFQEISFLILADRAGSARFYDDNGSDDAWKNGEFRREEISYRQEKTLTLTIKRESGDAYTPRKVKFYVLTDPSISFQECRMAGGANIPLQRLRDGFYFAETLQEGDMEIEFL